MKANDTIQIFDVPINNIRMDDAVRCVERAVDEQGKSKVYFVNTFYLNTAWEDSEYRRILSQGDYIFGDGTGVRIAAKLLRTPIVDNVNGTDMIFPLCELCQVRGFRLFLLGSKPGVAAGLKTWMEERYSGIEVAGEHHGYFNSEKERADIVDAINGSGANILLVGFSAPRQEHWIHEHADMLDCQVMMGVGGLFDVYAGEIYRPPSVLRKLGLEWLGRLYQEPRRLWRRYLLGNPKFLLRVLWWGYLRRGRMKDGVE